VYYLYLRCPSDANSALLPTMNHSDHVRLLRKGVPQPGGVWADLGAGGGAFTLALAELLGPEATIYAVDRDGGALRQLARAMGERFPATKLHCLTADFTHRLDLPLLDGLVMANSLHFVRSKEPVLQRVHGYLKPAGRLLLVEYNTDQGNIWVPHPLAFPTWQALANRNGFAATTLLATQPSRFLGEIYAAGSQKT
jgi:ubiquinone/menaquinone biosynthesis C-methylase UbiE